MKNRTLHDETWQIYSNKDWEAGWQEMKESGVYERGIFGDLMLFGISCGMKKVLLIFNTSLDSPHDPIYVIDPSKFGVEPDTQIPIVLAYNMSHYESVHPADKSDEEKSVNLVNQYVTGSYMYGKKDLPFLLHLENKIIETHKPEVVSKFNEEDKHVGKDIFLKSLPDHLKGKRPRDMTKEEKKEYDAKRKKFSRNSKNKTIIERTEEEKDLAKEKG